MKLLKWIIPAALLVFVLAPGLIGYTVESNIEEQTGGMAAIPLSSQVSISNTTVDRGWFGSDVDTEMSIDNPVISALVAGIYGEDSSEPPVFIVRTRASHGVLPLASPGKGGLRPALAQGESDVFVRFGDSQEQKLPIKVYSSTGVNKWLKMVVDPISNVALEDGATLSFAGAELSGTAGNNSNISGHIGDVNLSSPDFTMDIAKTNVETEMEFGQYAFPESSTTVSMPSIVVKSNDDGTAMSLKDMIMNAGLNVKGGRAILATKLETGAIENPGMNIDGVSLDMAYDLDADAFSKFQELANAAGSEPTNEQQQAIMGAMMGMLEKGGSVAVKTLDIDLGGSNAHLDLNLELPPGVNNPMMAIGSLSGEGNLVIPEAFVAKLQQISPEIGGGLAMASMTGFVQVVDGNYQTNMKFENGVLLLNDLPVPLPF